ncbi:hypothetical protein Psi01_58290 [Planobispora siamensis]|uniref:Uncharacterized protein n=1 Tax=Planobispora siamensis TaxID=936338 RepID=A0A8J3SMT2_9ACTN|nr:hypothetical protein Psi01_58290 [Planobispora siamensis]
MPPWMIRGSLSGGAAPVDASAIVTGETSCSTAVRPALHRPGAGEIQPGPRTGGVVTKVPKAEVAGHLRTVLPDREQPVTRGPGYWTVNRTVPTATNAAPAPMSTAPRPIAREVTCQAW